MDEQIIPTKCKSSIKQYCPKKPHKWGYKVFLRCGASGMIYDFEIYTGKSSSKPSQYGVTGDLVIRLCSNIPKHINHKVFFDNYLISLYLLKYLRNVGIQALDTIRPNRMMGAQHCIFKEKDLESSWKRCI